MNYSKQELVGVGGGLLSNQPHLTHQHSARLQVFGLIVLLHVLFIYALQHGLFRQIRSHLPAEIFITLVSTQSVVPALKSVPAQPKLPALAAVVPRPASLTASPQPELQATETQSAPLPIEIPAVPIAAPAQIANLPAQPKTISSGVEYIRAPQPVYPPQSRRMHEQGKTLLRVLISEKGLPESVQIQQSSGSTRLDDAARVAVLGALFKPFVDNGTPLAVYAVVPIRFQLDT